MGLARRCKLGRPTEINSRRPFKRGDTVHNCALVAAGKRHLSQPPKVSGTVPAGLTSKPQRPVASIMLQHPRGKLQSTPRKSLPERCASPRWSTESTAEGVLHRTSRTQSWTTATFGLKGGAHSHVHWQSSPNMGLCHLSVLPLKARRPGERGGPARRGGPRQWLSMGCDLGQEVAEHGV